MNGEDDPLISLLDGDLDLEGTARITARLAELTKGIEPDADGRTPFDELVGSTEVSSHRDAGSSSVSPIVQGLVEPVPEVQIYASDPVSVRRNWQWAAAAIVLVIAVGAGIGLAARRPEPHKPFPSVETLAARLGMQPDHEMTTGEYWYEEIETREDLGLTGVAHTIMTLQQWTAVDGTGRSIGTGFDELTNGSTTSLPATNSERTYDIAGSLNFLGLTYDELRNLPEDPQLLLDVLVATGKVSNDEPADAIARLASADVATPGVRRAAIEVLALLGGTTQGEIETANGQTGVAVVGESPGGPWTVVLDRDTGMPFMTYVGYGNRDDGSADLSTARLTTTFGSQRFTTTTTE